jgi:acetolactate synthase regulatory subunit
MWPTDKIVHILSYRRRPDLARAVRGCTYELNESTTYGNRLFSTLTTVEICAPIQKHEQLQKLTKEDKTEIVQAFHVLYPVRDRDIEIYNVEFLVDPHAPIPITTRQVSRLQDIDFVYIGEQIAKCDERIAAADFEGAITTARNLVESICKYILGNVRKQVEQF